MIFCARRTHAVETSLCSRAMLRRERRRRIVRWPQDARCDARTFGFIGQPALFKPRPLESTLPSSLPSCPNASPMCPMNGGTIFSPRGALRFFRRAPLCPPASQRRKAEGAHREGELGLRNSAVRRPRRADSSAAAAVSSAPRGAIAKHALERRSIR